MCLGNMSLKRKAFFILLEYLGKTSLQFKKHLKDIFRSSQENVTLNVIFKSYNDSWNAIGK